MAKIHHEKLVVRKCFIYWVQKADSEKIQKEKKIIAKKHFEIHLKRKCVEALLKYMEYRKKKNLQKCR